MLRPAFRGLLFASLLLSPALRAADTTRYTVLVDGGKQAGHQVVQRNDDGSVHVDFVFKDNGRGPELKEDYTLAPDGTFATYAVKGASTFGAPVDESFRVADGKASWTSTSDSGEQPAVAGAAYWALGGTPQSNAQVLSALLARSDNRLPLIPGGTLSARAVADVTLAGDRKVRLMRVTGVGFTPQFVWMTADAQPRCGIESVMHVDQLALLDAVDAIAGDRQQRRFEEAAGEALNAPPKARLLLCRAHEIGPCHPQRFTADQVPGFLRHRHADARPAHGRADDA